MIRAPIDIAGFALLIFWLACGSPKDGVCPALRGLIFLLEDVGLVSCSDLSNEIWSSCDQLSAPLLAIDAQESIRRALRVQRDLHTNRIHRGFIIELGEISYFGNDP